MDNKIISIDTLRYYNDKISNYVDEKVSDTVDNLELNELNAILVDTDAEADDPIVPDYVAKTEISHGTSDTTFTLTPNDFHVWDKVTELNITLDSETNGVANEFLFQFNSGSTATSLTLPDDIKWANNSAPTIMANKIYQISILKGLASVLVFDNTPKVITFAIEVEGGYTEEIQAEEGMTWGEWVDSIYNIYELQPIGNYIGFSDESGEIYIYYNSAAVLTSDIIVAGIIYNIG